MRGMTDHRRSDSQSRRDAVTSPQEINDADARELDLCSSTPTPPINRRRELLLRQTPQKISSLILASLILGESSMNAQQQVTELEPVIKAKTIVITGANSGIGFEACKRLMTKGHTIILACRSMEKAQEAIHRIQQQDTTTISSYHGTLIPAECDLADMSSIQTFVTRLPTRTKIDTLCLNAGVARNTAATDCARTKDGLELTGMMMYDDMLLLLLLTVATFVA
jgi:short chain dehydrogenase